ncbi:MAG: hypothetical protein U1E65_36585 [Myxococcota bacterium]
MLRTRLLPGLVVGLALATGCGGNGNTIIPPPDVVGALHVSWTVVNGAGEARTCDAAQIRTVAVSIGGTPTEVPCTDGMVSFAQVLPGRYPVIAKSKSALTVLQTLAQNATVAAAMTTEVSFRFVTDPTAGSRGAMHLTWTVDDVIAPIGCGPAGGSTVEITADDGSMAMFDKTVDCTVGEATIDNLPIGPYVPKLTLLNSAGGRITSALGNAVVIEADRTQEPPTINIVTHPVPKASLRAEWTINSSTATSACALVNGTTMRFQTIEIPPIVPTSSTVPCRRGFAVLSGLGSGRHDVRLDLDYGVGAVTSTVVREVNAVAGRTSTISVDLRTE